jgi:5-(carboxyamino)imidazole ribonucleotide synthase
MTRVGIFGAGQLGLMLGQAGGPLGLEFAFLDPAENPPAKAVGLVTAREFDSDDGLEMLAGCDVVTYEFENVPVAAVERLSARVPVFPPAAALEQAQDRVREKKLFDALGIPVAAWCPVSSREELSQAIRTVGLPLVLKTRRFGYDGKGQAIVRSANDAEHAWRSLGRRPLVAEKWIPFDREVSVFGARSRNGEIALYPLTENEHRDGILRISKAPAPGTGAGTAGDGGIARQAALYLRQLLTELDYVGVLALEMFVIGDSLLANEFAPRVHNSGHWTIEGAKTSQFENHLRAILGMPLGETACSGHVGMINLIGSLPPDPDELRALGSRLHDYGKAPRPGRKLGHITVIAADAATRDQQLSNALKLIGN